MHTKVETHRNIPQHSTFYLVSSRTQESPCRPQRPKKGHLWHTLLRFLSCPFFNRKWISSFSRRRRIIIKKQRILFKAVFAAKAFFPYKEGLFPFTIVITCLLCAALEAFSVTACLFCAPRLSRPSQLVLKKHTNETDSAEPCQKAWALFSKKRPHFEKIDDDTLY